MDNLLPQRKNIRLESYNYSSIGYYFITICTKNKLHLLSSIKDDKVNLTNIGMLLNEHINSIPIIYSNIKIDNYIIMPNHIHIILIITEFNGINISRVIQQLKRIISKKSGKNIWQKSFYEHVIRSEKEYSEICKYILNNPLNWEKDKYFKRAATSRPYNFTIMN